MVITLSIEQQSKIMEWIIPINEAHGNEGFEPPGYTIEVSIGGPYGCYAWAISETSRIELDEVQVKLS
jgi:hypothetical protein